MNNPVAKMVGQRIKELRTINKMSQSQLAIKLDLSDSIISGYERGVRTPSLEVLYKISEIFNVSPDVFFNVEYKTEERITVDLTDLTEDQFFAVARIIDEFFKYNKLKENKKD